ncbi:MAG: MFS transporter [Aminivibrio sp.]|jgi:ACDE family multidrug resistance protein
MDRLILSLTVVSFAVHSYSNAFFFLAPYLSLKGFTAASAGLLVGAFYAAGTAIRPAGSWLAERLGMRRCMMASSVLCFACALALCFNQSSFSWFMGVRIVMGAAYSVFLVALTTYQALVIEESKRGLGFVLISLGCLVPMFTVVPLTDYLIRSGLERFYMLLPVMAAALSFFLALKLKPAACLKSFSGAEGMEWGTYKDLFRETPAGKIIFSCFFFSLCDASIVFIGIVIMEKNLVPSWFIFSLSVGALLIRTLGRHIFNRYRRTVFAGPSFLLMGLCLMGLSFASTPAGLVFWGVFYGLGMGFGYPAHLAFTGDLAPPGLRAKASALVHFSLDLSWFVLPVYMGFGCTLLGTIAAFRVFAALCIVTAVITTIMWLPGRGGGRLF